MSDAPPASGCWKSSAIHPTTARGCARKETHRENHLGAVSGHYDMGEDQYDVGKRTSLHTECCQRSLHRRMDFIDTRHVSRGKRLLCVGATDIIRAEEGSHTYGESEDVGGRDSRGHHVAAVSWGFRCDGHRHDAFPSHYSHM